MASLRSKLGGFIKSSLALFMAFLFLAALVAPAARVFADAADPIPPATTGNYVVNGDGSITLTVQGQWQWTTHHSNCNLDRFGVGWAVDWHDASAPGNLITGKDANNNPIVAHVGTPSDNAVHYAASPPYCGVYDPNVDYNSGNWGPISHTYPAGTTTFDACVVTYDIHGSLANGPDAGFLVAGGANHNDDNSVEKNGKTPLGNGCFSANIQNLVVVKHVINDSGGQKSAGDFTMNVTANSPSQSSFAGSESGTTVQVGTGSYSVDETADAGYAKSLSAGCSGTIAAGETKICTITNNDIAPTLKLVKTVTNNNGGNKTANDFQAKIDGNNVAWSTVVPVTAGAHTASETTLPSYSASDWGGDCAKDGSITLAAGQQAVCTITNDDIAPKITVNKLVSNPYGTPKDANLFPLFVDSTQVTNGATNTQFNAGNHTVSETQQTGYMLSDVSGDCNVSNSVISIMLDIGTTKSCTLTNTAIQPKLIVKKHVINNNSGTESADDFTMTVSGNSVVVPNFAGDEAGTTINLNEGNYSVDELPDAGYTKNLGADCSGTIAIGETKTCIVTNDDIAHPSIHVVKSGATQAHEGDTVTYNFTVTNTGDTALSALTVKDNVAGDGNYQSGDTNHDGILQTTETWIYTKDFVIPANQTDDVVNTVTACGHYIDTKVCDTDDHTLDVLHPSIQVIKSGPATALAGSTVTYDFLVTNTGDVELTNVGIDDDIATGETCLANVLAVSESTTCTATYTIPTSQTADVTNHVTASGTDTLQETVTDTDEHTLVVLNPSIHVVKSGPSSAVAGSTITYTFTVTNTGNTPLSGVTVNDNIAGAGTYQSGDDNNNDILETDETWIYTAQYTIPANQTTGVNNTVTACGTLTIRQIEDNELDISSLINSLTNNNQTVVCDQDQHSLTVPQVLAATTPPLVNTGQTALLEMLAGLTILGMVGALTVAARNSKQTAGKP